MLVYLIRHGESQSNLDKIWSGWNDVPLTEKGKNDAKKAGEYLDGIKFDKIYSSDLSRAKNTAEIAIPGCEYEQTPLLREINVGDIVGKPFNSEEYNRIDTVLNGYGTYNGESFDDMSSRIKQFMDIVSATEYNKVACFTHAGVLRVFLDITVGKRLSRQNILCKNCAIAIFECDNDVWKLHSWINLD